MASILKFLREVRVELGKVSWPSRTQMIQYTGVVVGLCLFFALYLGALDSGFAWILSRFVNP
jgi:preprotein translocase subunit SecE